MERLRILHLITAGDVIAGAEQLLVGIAQLADRARWDLAFCSLTPRGSLHREVDLHGWPTHALDLRGFGSVPGTAQRLRRLLADFQPDIVHTHLTHATIAAAAVAAIDARITLVQTRHYADYVARFRPRRLAADAWAARQCRAVIAVSGAAKAQLVGRERVKASRVTIVDNGVAWETLEKLDHDEGRERLTALGVSPGPTIGCAASFNECKGHPSLLLAMVRVLLRFPTAQLVLFGTGEDEAKVRAQATGLGLGSHVYFLGHRSDVHPLMAGLDVYVQPSIEEGFGLALIEAMATRRPVVATAVGGMLQTVDPGRTGLRVPPADPASLAGAIVALLDDPTHAAELGKNASEIVRQRYSLDRMLDQYDAVYRKTLATS